MKRALAERAKQSGLPNGVSTVSAATAVATATAVAVAPIGANDTTGHGAISVPVNGATTIPAHSMNGEVDKGRSTVQEPPAVLSSSLPDTASVDVQDVPVPRRMSSQGTPSPSKVMSTTTPSADGTPSSTVTAAAARVGESTTASTASSPSPLSPLNTISTQQQQQQGRQQDRHQIDTPPPPRPSPRPRKRQRESVVKLEEEDEEDSNASAFYLRHQNRALASELRSVKYQLTRLERERDYRREQCKQAVDNLNTLQSVWTQLEVALTNRNPPSDNTAANNASISSSSTTAAAAAPFSTGSGPSVELVNALLSSLSRLSPNRPRVIGDKGKKNSDTSMDVDGDDDDDDESDARSRQNLSDISFVSRDVKDRAAALQKWILTLLQRLDGSNGGTDASTDSSSPSPALALQEQLTVLQARNSTLQEELDELARSRDEIAESDRRVRRGLYRLAAGRMELKEVLKAISNADDDKEAAAAFMESTTAAPSGNGAAIEEIKAEEDGDSSAAASSAEVAKLKKQISDLEEVASARDTQIQKLLSEREEQTKRINTLVLQESKPPAEVTGSDDIQKSEIFIEQSARLAASERKCEELNQETNQMREKWAHALADAETSKNAMEEMQTKHMKRWAELAEEHPDIGSEDGDGNLSGSKAEEIATLQHKLTQALENVRQAEATRSTLNEAVNLNASLQAKVEEFKAKYSALQAEKTTRTTTQVGNNGSAKDAETPSASSGEMKPSSSGQSSEKADKSDRSFEKLQRDFKRARKELAAAQASKDSAKAKLERTEKEREFLNQMNSRLLKQASEKDEINAKSLSTILHLKQLTEQVSKERDNLEQQVKSAEQLSLATRLASNARERLTEEFEKERSRLENEVKEWEEKCESLVKEKEAAESRFLQERSRMSSLINDAQKAKDRCEELVSESRTLQEEKQSMMEALAIAQREANEATGLSQRLARSSGSGMTAAGFTAEQLHTQVNVLKSRIACPVCNTRDKKCILIRCRHMFCKECVEENIKNRSRKCPACGVRFDTKDVADVWL